MVEFKLKENNVIMDSREIPVMGEYDVVVVGGGMAGCGAAIAAGKAGKKVIVIENTSALGGLATMGLVNIPFDFLSSIGKEFFKELEEIGGLEKHNSNPEKHKLLLDRMLEKYGCDTLLVTPLIDTIVEDNTVRGVVVHTKQGARAILGKRFVDASGDSDLVFFGGGETMSGRPEDGISMGCSLDFMLGGVDIDKYYESGFRDEDPKWVKHIAAALEDGRLPYDIDNHLNWWTLVPDPNRPKHCGMDEVGICFSHSRYCRPTDNKDLTRMYREGREQAAILTEFIRSTVPGFENCYLCYTGSLLGVRESRRIVGEYIFTGTDIAYARKFDDVIAISQHGFDLHGFTRSGNMKWFKGKLPDGRDAYIANRAGWGSQLPPDDGLPRINMKELCEGDVFYYDIPYRSLVPAKLDNVLAAGRNISADVPGQSGTRLIMCCMSLGEAAGTASALSIDEGVTPRKLDVLRIQRKLVENNSNIGQAYRKIPGIADGDYSEHYIVRENNNG